VKNLSKSYLVILVLLIVCLSPLLTITSPVKSSDEVKILCFIEDDFGQSYYINKGFLEAFNYSVITASSKTLVTGCDNPGKEVNDTYSDLLVSDISDANITHYDCILIPSGGHWSNLMSVHRTIEIIQLAHEKGILVAGICTGMIVLAFADILRGVNVAQNYHAASWLEFAGANMTAEKVVADQGIITGGWGGGLGHGPDDAPNEAFCTQIKTEIEVQKTKRATLATIGSFAAIISLSMVIVFILQLRRKN